MIIDLAYFQSDNCRKRVFEHARTALREGHTTLTPEIIAAAAQVPRSVVLHHFPDMPSLRNLLLEDFFLNIFPEIIGAAFRRLCLSHHTLTELDLVKLFLDILGHMVQEYPCFFQADFQGGTERQLHGWTFFQTFLDRYLGLVESMFAKGRAAGIFAEDLTSSSVRQFLRGLFLGSTVQCLFLQDGCDPSWIFEKVKEQTQTLLCSGRYDWRMLTD